MSQFLNGMKIVLSARDASGQNCDSRISFSCLESNFLVLNFYDAFNLFADIKFWKP